MSDEERNQRVVRAFGARGLLAFNSILNASFTTMRDGCEVTLKGAEAITALRKEMEGASGTAASFREQLLDTFEGQKTLLAGTLQTFAVVLGEPFAKVFKPIVKAVVDALNMLLRAFQLIPGPIKRVFAGVIVATGGILALVGGFIAGKAAVVLFSIGLNALGLTFGGLLVTLWPVALALGAVAAVVAGFMVAFRADIGGLRSTFKRVWEGVKLYLNGLQQLFEQGGFSGAVMKELGRAENQGIKRFLISTYRLLHRLGQIWEGFKGGFVGAIEAARPIFQNLSAALQEIGAEFGAIYSELWGGAANLPVAGFRSFGEIAGEVLGALVTLFTKLISVFARLTGGFSKGLRRMVGYIRPAFKVVGDAVMRLVTAWRQLTGETLDGAMTIKESSSAWGAFGEVLGRVFGGAVTVITLAFSGLIDVLAEAIRMVDQVKVAFSQAGTWIGETAAKIYLWFLDVLPGVLSRAVDIITGFFRALGAFFVGIWRWFSGLFQQLAQGIISFLQPVVEFFEGVASAIKRVFNQIRDTLIRLLREVPDELLPSHLERMKRMPLSSEMESSDEPVTSSGALSRVGSLSAMPSVADTKARMDELAHLEDAIKSQRPEPIQNSSNPLQINLQVDGETIASAMHNAQRDDASRSFSPVPVY